jgi:hypothetical protein
MKQKIILPLLSLIILLAPTLVFAQIEGLISRVGNIMNFALSLVMPIAVIALIIAGYQYIAGGSSPEQTKKATYNITWIIIGMIVIILAKALIIFALSSLGVDYSVFGLSN